MSDYNAGPQILRSFFSEAGAWQFIADCEHRQQAARGRGEHRGPLESYRMVKDLFTGCIDVVVDP